MPDLDGDGTPELAVGAPFAQAATGNADSGALWILHLTPDGFVKAETRISQGEGGFLGTTGNSSTFGAEPTSLGDIDGDGRQELAVGATNTFDFVANAFKGALYILSLNPDGSVGNDWQFGPAELAPHLAWDGSQFARGIASLGDRDGDGGEEIAVFVPALASEQPHHGRVAILSLAPKLPGLAPEILGATFIEAPAGEGFFEIPTATLTDGFGAGLASLGDFDGDGIGDLVIGSPFDSDTVQYEGSLRVTTLAADGQAKQFVETRFSSLAGAFLGGSSQGFGEELALAGDIDLDGTPDLLVGSSAPNDGAWLLLMNPDGSVKRARAISATGRGGFPAGLTTTSERFGASAALLGDLDGNGTVEVAVGAPYDDDGCLPPDPIDCNQGAVWILSLTVPPDADGDGIADRLDAFPADPAESADTDKDGLGNKADLDDDDDGFTDVEELDCGSNPLDPADFPTIGTGGELICVPEPAALLQLAAGLAALLAFARRRRSARRA